MKHDPVGDAGGVLSLDGSGAENRWPVGRLAAGASWMTCTPIFGGWITDDSIIIPLVGMSGDAGACSSFYDGTVRVRPDSAWMFTRAKAAAPMDCGDRRAANGGQ